MRSPARASRRTTRRRPRLLTAPPRTRASNARPRAGEFGSAYDHRMPRFHHVNLGIYEDGLDAQAEFLVGVIGLRRIDPGPELAGLANWFEADDGTQVHLSKDPEHTPAARAHVAMEFGGELGDVERRLQEGGYSSAQLEFDGRRIVICCDPAGNRWELRGDPLPA